ncbi:hypothetical protein N7449_004363 [Penicillium cf. viridicatum]|uniref:Uncharacterized protein n=1 Tax=Penicillium cf. viridicatum TaxID=2972119 RepID=A0A9W9MJ84_9EURO|nr:hypothetical protein N7449_004363 [Penicillium cf. viridicatum]
MATHPLYSALYDGQSESDIELERFEFLASPRMSVPRRASDTEMGPSETDATTLHTQNPQTDTETKRPRFDWSGSWAWEIGSVTLAVVGLVLLVAFLITINNAPYATGQYTVSPNTIVSIIITIIKAALLVSVSSCLGQLKWNLFQNPAPLYHIQVIDQASRGPWGSLEVLLRGISGSRTGSLTYVGASLTVLALVVDPFAQQILTFPSRTVPALDAASFTPTSQHWYSIEGSDQSDVDTGLEPALFVSMMSGLLGTYSSPGAFYFTNHLVFPELVTLGMCSKCEDVTARTKQKCHAPEISLFLDTIAEPLRKIPTNCSYQTPNNFTFDFEEFDFTRHSDDTVIFGINHWSLRPRVMDLALDIRIPTFDIQTPVASFIAINYTTTVTYAISNATAPPTKAIESTYLPGHNQNNRPMQVVDTQQLIPTVALEDPHLTSSRPIHFAPPNGSATLSNDSSYSVDLRTFGHFADIMMSLFNSTTQLRGEVPASTVLKLGTILRMDNLNRLLDSMSTSVTDTFRTSSLGHMIPVTTFRKETFIHVRWPWIILPVIVTLGSVALLLGTAIGSKHRKAVLWKCMVLPLLISHLDTTPENRIASVRSVDGMTDISKKMRAVMAHDEGPLIFKEK